LRTDYRFYVYIIASRSRVLYVGMTKDLVERTRQHRFGLVPGFTTKYRCTRLVHCELYHYVNNCIRREKEIKAWRREKKVALIEAENSTWEDLAADWFCEDGSVNLNSRSLASLGMTNWRDDDLVAAIQTSAGAPEGKK